MPRRPALGPATAALCAVLALTACQGSPEAGQPNTASPPSSSTTPSTPIPSTSTWAPEEQAAIDAAKARYSAATAAVDKALANPAALDRNALEKVGVGGEWIITVIDEARSLTRNGWYQTGSTQIADTQVTSVKLDGSQPEVNLANCLDSSKIVLRFKKDGKPVPLGPGNGRRHKFNSRLVFAPPATGGPQIWFLIADKASGKC